MLRITKAEDQALRLAMSLAASRKRQTLTLLAEAERLPEPTVAKLLGLLRRGGVVVAHRGRHGGYGLAAEPEAVSVADVLRCLGSEPAPHHPCVEKPQAAGDCPRLDDCGLRSVWRHLQNQVTSLLESTSLLFQPDASVDAVIISDLLFHVEHKNQVLQEAHRILRAGGRILVVDWRESFGGVGPEPDHVISEGEMIRGPTTDICRISTLKIWGSSSRLALRRNRPIGVTRGSSLSL